MKRQVTEPTPTYSLADLIQYCMVANRYSITGYETNKAHWEHLLKVLKHMRCKGFAIKQESL